MGGIEVKDIFKWPYKTSRPAAMEENWFSLTVTVMEDGSEYVNICDKKGAVTHDGNILSSYDRVRLHAGAAIEVAKGILKHFDIDFNAYEDNISDRYRPLTDDEVQQAIKDNPNIVPIYLDPDAPLTSEIKLSEGAVE